MKFWKKKKVESKNPKQEFRYKNWKQLFADAWLKTFSSKEEFFDERFIKDLEEKIIENDNLNDQEKMSAIHKICADWENHFHNSRFLMLEKVVSNAEWIIDNENMNYLIKTDETLPWFEISNNRIDLSRYEEPFSFEDLNSIMEHRNNNEYCFDLLESKFINWNGKHFEKEFLNISHSPLKKLDQFYTPYAWDGRFFMIGSTKDYETHKDEWINSIDKTIQEVKETYQTWIKDQEIRKNICSVKNESNSYGWFNENIYYDPDKNNFKYEISSQWANVNMDGEIEYHTLEKKEQINLSLEESNCDELISIIKKLKSEWVHSSLEDTETEKIKDWFISRCSAIKSKSSSSSKDSDSNLVIRDALENFVNQQTPSSALTSKPTTSKEDESIEIK